MSGTQRKEGRRVAVREASVREALASDSRKLEPVEERVLRALHGGGVPVDAPLEAKASGAALQSLHDLEVELFRRYRAHLDPVRPQASETKDRIVRALRRKR